ncbi:TPA: hypothetical protein ACMDRZ_003673 [Vibrio cholerae]|uniref:hypothetical protein n=1 Tax=Vibrio cholerae TaxID=666 RepID=UPI001582CF36|nr:hypothetical protein [Vibrio cholerae]QKU68593.1 hypothetical protein HPY10_15515 [Vibrio cholerae]QKU72401.1 hypothetical protein HPY09_15925 [Vibrio cholerae]QKU76356.1 hypothetical protein HPY05_15930 [Vibrio cholerae]
MAFEAKVFRVLIASPSDVIEEREIAVRTIQEWNDLHSHDRQIVLLPLRWESHSSPEYGRRPQEVINRQIVDDCDFLVGIFWSKIGSPTGVKESGTIEEISRVASASKPVMLYFSNAKKDLEDIDLDQLAKLRDFKKQTYPNALVENYTTQVEFRDKLSKHLEMQIRQLIASGKDGALSKGLLSEIELSWFDLEKQNKNGKSCSFSTVSFEVLNRSDIPDYELEEESDGEMDWLGERTNKNYFRDLADFFVTDNLLKPIQLCLENKGSLGARDLYISIRFTSEKGDLVVLSGAGFDSQKPQTKHDHLLWTGQKRIEIAKDSNTYSLSYELNALQPKRSVQTDLVLYVGTTESSKVTVEATIYADSLPEPVKQELELNFNVKKESVEARELLQRLSKKRKAKT